MENAINSAPVGAIQSVKVLSRYAAAALSGMLANANHEKDGIIPARFIAEYSFDYALAMLNEQRRLVKKMFPELNERRVTETKEISDIPRISRISVGRCHETGKTLRGASSGSEGGLRSSSKHAAKKAV